MPETLADGRLDRRSLVAVLALSVPQDALYSLLFLSYMNHYLLDVLHGSAGLPAFTLSLYAAVKLAVQPFAGRVIDRFSAALALRAALLLEGAALGTLLAVHSLAGFLAGTALFAAAAATVWPLAWDAVARTQREGARAPATGIVTVGSYAATAVGFLAGVLLAGVPSWRAAFFGAAFLVLVQTTVLRSSIVLRSTERTEHRATPAGGRVIRRSLGLFGLVASSIRARSWRRMVVYWRRLGLFGLVAFLDYAAVTSLAGVYGPYVRKTLDISLAQAVPIVVPAALAALLGLAAASRWSRPGRRYLELALFYVLAGTGALALALAPGPIAATFAAIPLGAGLGGIGPIIAALLIEVAGDANRALLMGVLLSVAGLGTVIGNFGVAEATELGSARAGFAAIGGVFAVLTVVTLVATRRNARAAPAAPIALDASGS